jgi:hypothetical protein
MIALKIIAAEIYLVTVDNAGHELKYNQLLCALYLPQLRRQIPDSGAANRVRRPDWKN